MQVGQQIGPFIIEGELGSGAMGTVYRATFTQTGQPVAFKVIAFGLTGNETALARFEREANILKQLRHPNIVRLVGHGRYKGTPFIAMEFIEGETLDDVLVRRGRHSWEEVVTIGQQLCAALQHAHERGIIHRDLKPANMMITRDGVVKLTDFGIAKDVDVTALTGANSTIGTAAYMSPEQCRGERSLSGKSDLYSMGIVFYELLTGRKPFLADSPVDMFMQHVAGKFERPGRLVPDMPRWLDTLVCQLMEKKPDARPIDAATVARQLGEVVEKVTARASRGAEVATARRVDREKVDAAKLEDTDREAAKTIRAGRKKSKTKKSKPFNPKLYQALAYAGGLLAILGLLTYFLWPAPAGVLHKDARERYQAWREADGPDQAYARRGLLNKSLDNYLSSYGNLDDEPTRQVREWQNELAVADREGGLHNRHRFNRKEEDAVGELARDALTAEDAGDLKTAVKRWTELRDGGKGTGDPDARGWAALAEKKLRDHEAAARRAASLAAEVQTDVRAGKMRGRPTHEEEDAAEATRYQLFGDAWAARELWAKLAERLRKSFDQRQLLLLAADRLAVAKVVAPEQPDKSKERDRRRELVGGKLEEAVKLRADPRRKGDVLTALQEVHDLYKSDPDDELKKFAARAKAESANVP